MRDIESVPTWLFKLYFNQGLQNFLTPHSSLLTHTIVQLQPFARHHKARDDYFAFVNHLVVFFAQRDEVVLVVLVEMVDVTGVVCLLLLGDVVDIFDAFIAQCTFCQVEFFVVLAAFALAELFDLAAVVTETFAYILCHFEEFTIHME